MIDLVRAREVRAAVADGVLPHDGWPRVAPDALTGTVGAPVPKCSMIPCCEPGIVFIRVASLLDVTSSNTYSCAEHLDHFVRAAADWMRT